METVPRSWRDLDQLVKNFISTTCYLWNGPVENLTVTAGNMENKTVNVSSICNVEALVRPH